MRTYHTHGEWNMETEWTFFLDSLVLVQCKMMMMLMMIKSNSIHWILLINGEKPKLVFQAHIHYYLIADATILIRFVSFIFRILCTKNRINFQRNIYSYVNDDGEIIADCLLLVSTAAASTDKSLFLVF